MEFLNVTHCFYSWRRKRLRNSLRGFRLLRKIGHLGYIDEINRTLTKTLLSIKPFQYSQLFFGHYGDKAELICRQYLIVRIIGLASNGALLDAIASDKKGFTHPMPVDWQNTIESKQIGVSRKLCSLLWWLNVTALFGHGLLTIARISLKSISHICSRRTYDLGVYSYFHLLNANNLPQSTPDNKSHDIITWYISRFGTSVNNICHNVKGAAETKIGTVTAKPIDGPVLPLTTTSALIQFLRWGFSAIVIAFLDLLRGRWWHAYILNQAAVAAQVRYQDPKLLAHDYLFYNSAWFYRPMWTYEAEQKGSCITMYFYSTNCEKIQKDNSTRQLYYGWEVMNWQRYLVWDRYQADFVRLATGNSAAIEIVGSIWFQASKTKIPPLPMKTVAVFDVTPQRISRYWLAGPDYEYYTPEVCNRFISDIQELCSANGFIMAWKIKREIGKHAHPKYRRFTHEVGLKANVINIAPDTSAHHLIESCSISISLPFTSTALIARELAKPCCYYDPTGMIGKDDRAAHGIPIVSGRQELSDWLKKIITAGDASGAVLQQEQGQRVYSIGNDSW